MHSSPVLWGGGDSAIWFFFQVRFEVYRKWQQTKVLSMQHHLKKFGFPIQIIKTDRKIKMICHKTFSISTMGQCAIKSHTKRKMHLSRKPISSGIASFFWRNNRNVSNELSTSSCYSKDQIIDTILLSNDTVKPEIIWVLKTVLCK